MTTRTPEPLDGGAFAQQARTARELCGASPAVCEECLLVLEVDADAGELFCGDCRGRWRADALVPCPRPATSIVHDADGSVDAMCAAHSVLWRKLVAHAAATIT
jgi:hypothetical protein